MIFFSSSLSLSCSYFGDLGRAESLLLLLSQQTVALLQQMVALEVEHGRSLAVDSNKAVAVADAVAWLSSLQI